MAAAQDILAACSQQIAFHQSYESDIRVFQKGWKLEMSSALKCAPSSMSILGGKNRQEGRKHVKTSLAKEFPIFATLLSNINFP